MTEEKGGGGQDDGPQLQIWEGASRRQQLGSLSVEGVQWEVHLVVEAAATDLFRGRIAFRNDDDYLVTAPVIVEESESGVVERAESLPESMVEQFFVSVHG